MLVIVEDNLIFSNVLPDASRSRCITSEPHNTVTEVKMND